MDFFGHIITHIGIMDIKECILIMPGVMDTHYMVGITIIRIIIYLQTEGGSEEKLLITEVQQVEVL